jgi:inosine-uridine nucleoside N-ribohydrolase
VGRKVIIDCDPGIDDAVALCMALFDPRLEVLAVTATAGNVGANQASRNVQAIIEQLDPPRLPRIGVASAADHAPSIDYRHIHGADGLGNSGFQVSPLQHKHPAEKVISDTVRGAPDEVTIVTLGPLTNIARAFQRDVELPTLVDRIIMMGGSLNGVGNITPVAEFNMYYDPQSARDVLRSLTTKTLIPLDITKQLRFDLDLIDTLPPQYTRAGGFLRKILPHLYRSYHQELGQESIHLHDAVAILAATNDELFDTVEMDGDVETAGELTTGFTVFDRRSKATTHADMEVATNIDVVAARNRISEAIERAGNAS